jgi:carbamoyl-phosphate synthase large subunit
MIDEWFLGKLLNLVQFEQSIAGVQLDKKEYMKAKKLGYTDKALERITGHELPPKKWAYYKMVDTCAAEYNATTPYFYSTFDNFCEARRFRRSGRPVVMVLGSGPIRIGQGIEFDYSSVHCVWTLKELGYDVVIVNNNPETVSTDYDTADRLYFEPLTPEDVMNIIEVEKPIGVVVAFGGQTAIKLTEFLDRSGVQILGTSQDSIDLAEDRARFDALLEEFSIRRPKGKGVDSLQDALETAQSLGYPVLLRPSYVIGGQNMVIAHNDDDVKVYMEMILNQGIENSVLVDKYMSGMELEVDVISDGVDVLIPGIMRHVERAGVHSGDSIAVYPPYGMTDRMIENVVEVSTKLALAMKTKGLVNIQYLFYHGKLYVIEVNPRASRTIPYISKVTGVPMVDLATRVMMGEPLKDMGYGVGLYPTPPYVCVKVPVFSFEKLTDANSRLGPEMKSTGEALGLGRTMTEALFKGLTSSGMTVASVQPGKKIGALISVDDHDLLEVVGLAKKLDDLGVVMYAPPNTATAIEKLGIHVNGVKSIKESDHIFDVLESGNINFIVYTGDLLVSTYDHFRVLHRRAMQLSIPCLTSLDTANALADIMASRYTQDNTELVDINHMRKERMALRFYKMEGTGNDYIVIDNRDGVISCPESLCISECDRNYGIGADGIAIIEASQVADAKMRIFNRDGSEGAMAGNCIRCVAKYLYDNGVVQSDEITVETGSGIKSLKLYVSSGKVTSVEVDMGQPSLQTADLPCTIPEARLVDHPAVIGGEEYRITCVSMGNPHCVIFVPAVGVLDLDEIGPKFENAPIFPERVNTEFVRVVNKNTLKMRCYERGNGETLACGTGACAAVVAAVENGFCNKNEEIIVQAKGGDLIVRYTDEGVTLTGNARLVYTGELEY